MKKSWLNDEDRYFGIGIHYPKTEENVGTLWRTALIYGASYIFIIGAKYDKPSSDVFKTWSKIPLFQFKTVEAFLDSVPFSCKLVGIEIDDKAIPIKEYTHPPRAIYLLGSEDNGLPPSLIEKCHDIILLPGDKSLNVAVAGSVTIFDRINKES